MAYLLHSDFFFALPRGWKYVLYIITNVFLPFYKKIIPRIIAASNFFLWYMSFILSLIFCTFLPKNNTAVYHVCQHFFRDLCPYIINTVIGKISQYSTFFNAMHTYSLITISLQIRASIFDENSI